MGEIMDKNITCAPDCKATDEVKAAVDAMAEGDVLISRTRGSTRERRRMTLSLQRAWLHWQTCS